MKVRASVKKICMKCKIVHRRGVVRVICVTRSTASARDKEGRDAWHVLQAWICRPISGCGSASRPSTASGSSARARSAARPTWTETKKIKDLTEEEVNRLRPAIESEGRVEGDLRKEIADEHPAAD